MELIPKEDLTKLKDASEVKQVADEAIDLMDISSAAHLINTAANTGQHSVLWQHPMSDKLRSELESKGYEIIEKLGTAIEKSQWIIRGF